MQQKETLQSFQAGTHNLLISTKTCEDMDIAPASMIIQLRLPCRLAYRAHTD